MSKPKASHGGRREGAGRKPKYPDLGATHQVNFWLPEKINQFIEDQATAADLNRSEWLTRRLLRSYRRTRKSP